MHLHYQGRPRTCGGEAQSWRCFPVKRISVISAAPTRGRGEVLGQAGAAEACAYALEGVSKSHKSKMTTNSSNSATSCLSQYFPPHPSTIRWRNLQQLVHPEHCSQIFETGSWLNFFL